MSTLLCASKQAVWVVWCLGVGGGLELDLHGVQHLVMKNDLGIGREGRLQLVNNMRYWCLCADVCVYVVCDLFCGYVNVCQFRRSRVEC